MRINISLFLKVFKWSLGVSTLLLVKLLIIFPLAGLLFHDLYLRLLPPDSSQWAPLSTFNELDGGFTLTQQIKRIGLDHGLPETKDNGISQPIFLRDHILYKIDLDLQFYCIHNWESTPQSNIVQFKVGIYDGMRSRKLFVRNIPIVCLGEELPLALGESSMKYGTSRSELYRKEWLNQLKLDDKVEIGSHTNSLLVEFETKQPAQLILDPESGLTFRMRFPQGLLNFMQRWRKTSYVVGIAAFDLAITTLFGITTLVSFSVISKKLSNDNFKIQ